MKEEKKWEKGEDRVLQARNKKQKTQEGGGRRRVGIGRCVDDGVTETGIKRAAEKKKEGKKKRKQEERE